MMPIVAISMTDSDLEELEFLQDKGKFSNRSDVVRHAVQTLLSEHRTIENVKGTVTAVFAALYNKKGHGEAITAVQHEYGDAVTALIHDHTSEGNCVEVMVVTSDANQVREFLKKLRAQKKVLKVDVSLVGGCG
ncbi:MAG: CopG family ribbon-helix-helix protein [Candidatus Thorarchaeota archaeon]|jgi:CopG family nickel-responsive transcriptional regulator